MIDRLSDPHGGVAKFEGLIEPATTG